MSVPIHANYEPAERASRNLFIQMITEVCATQNVTVRWLSEDWIAELQKDDTTRFIYGYTFSFNNASSAGILRDKVAMYGILDDADIPAIPHFLLRFNNDRDTVGTAKVAQKFVALPLVLKPYIAGRGGHDVVRCDTPGQLDEALQDLAARHQNLAVSPFTPITREFRVIILAGEPLLIFSKTPAQGEWRHNLRLGARPEVVHNAELAALARRTLQTVGAELAAVDIVKTPDGYKIMEVNTGISLASFARFSSEYRQLATKVYARIIAESLLGE